MTNLTYTFLNKDTDLINLTRQWEEKGIQSVAMDFEEESNLHVYGEHLCLIQLYDRENYYIVDALALSPETLKLFLENKMEKIMFACASDAAIARKVLNIQLNNIFDVRVIAMTLGFMGNLSGLIKRNLKIETGEDKKKFQKTNWMKRPLSEEQIQYALGDVKYLFQLKETLIKELAGSEEKLQKTAAFKMKNCAKQLNPEKPGWEKICNWKRTPKDVQLYVKEFFLARDKIARRLNRPAGFIMSKSTIVKMAYEKNYFHSTYDKEFRAALNNATEKEKKWN